MIACRCLAGSAATLWRRRIPPWRSPIAPPGTRRRRPLDGTARLRRRPRGRSARLREQPLRTRTLTRDTDTGLRWLDVTLSLDYSYSEILAALGPGGTFEGFRLGTGEEVATLAENAGVDRGTGLFVPENYDPIVALTNLVGQTGDNGNCGTGCSFNFSAGWYDSGNPAPQFLFYMTLSWFDNSAPLSPNYPQAPIGRILSSTTSSDAGSPTRGAWLVAAPEPEAPALAAAAALALAVLRRCRQCGGARGLPA
jgi:hypothetical protein